MVLDAIQQKFMDLFPEQMQVLMSVHKEEFCKGLMEESRKRIGKCRA